MSNPEADLTTTQLNLAPIPTEAPSQVSKLSRSGVRLAGRAILTIGLGLGNGVAAAGGESLLEPQPAYASTVFVNDYPDMDAADCSALYGVDSWCKGNPWSDISSRKYGYRNCTDGVAYWTHKYTGRVLPDWGNANKWATTAPQGEVIPGTTKTDIEPGDIAQSNDGSLGHVGFITSVTKNSDSTIASFTAAELNKGNDGDYSSNIYNSRNSAGKFIRSTNREWDNFIDVNGIGYGLNNEPLSGGDPAPPPPPSQNDLAWWTPDGTIYSMDNQGLGTQAQESGFEPPDWAGVMDYSGDGFDDLIQYRQSDGTLWALENDHRGSWNAVLARGPGVGVPDWAGVGDLDGDGRKNDLVWWTPDGTLYKFTGPGFGTASSAAGLGTPDWAGVMDYNSDGRDDVVWYRKSDGTLWVVLNNPNGGWTLPSAPVRGPGIGPPEWAGVGDMDGDGRKNDLAWWTPDGTLYKFVGSDLHTASATSGLEPPNGAVIMDYNQDGRDDVVQYRKSDGTLWAIQNNPIGGWSSVLIRGPGVGPPSWFGAGNFDGK